MTSDKRTRQKQTKAEQRQREQKARSRREIRKRVLTALGIGTAVALVLVVSANLGGDGTALPPAYQAARELPTACGADAPPPNTATTYPAAADQALEAPVTVVLETSCGEITLTLDPSAAPQTVNSFVFLAREGFYDGTIFHRIMPGFMIQGGDPLAAGFGGSGYALPDEFPPPDFVYERGVVAMANSGRGTTGSQFFIVIGADAASLSNTYTVIGTVTAGDETLDRISSVPLTARTGTAELSKPTETVYLERVTITE